MRRSYRLPALLCTVAIAAAPFALADDKELLRRTVTGNPNILIIYGNSQTTVNPLDDLTNNARAWDGDGDSPNSKMGLSKRVIRQFVADKGNIANFGLSRFASNPNAGAITLLRKHFLYESVADVTIDTLTIPQGVIWRLGSLGEGPCTNRTVPDCTAVSTSYVALPGTAPTEYRGDSYFFGDRLAGKYQPAYLYLSPSRRVVATLDTGTYGQAYTNGGLGTLILGTHSHVVSLAVQTKSGNKWDPVAGTAATATLRPYVPAGSPLEDLYFTTGAKAGQQIGFLQNGFLQRNGSYSDGDFDVNANCSGWLFQSASAPQPLVKIPRDYLHGAACDKAPQSSLNCIRRVLRPQGVLVDYNVSGAKDEYVTTFDYHNPGYDSRGGSKVADGCDATLLGATDPKIGLDIAEMQAVLTTRNGSQAPIKNLLTDIYKYLNDPTIDGFKNGKRADDPLRSCRTTAVIMIYDNFNGCQNDNCEFLKKMNGGLEDFKRMQVPIYVIGLGASAGSTANAGQCIAENSGAVAAGQTKYFPVTSATGLYKALADITSLLTESTRDFASASISSVQAGGEQMAYLATFNAAQNRSIWDGRLTGYKLEVDGYIKQGERTVTDPNDPFVGVKLSVPSNSPDVLIWNAGMNLRDTPGTGAIDPNAILAPGDAMDASGSYTDNSNDVTTTIKTRAYPGRKIVFSLPATYPMDATTKFPTQVPLPPAAAVPEVMSDLTALGTETWWPTMKALLGDQQTPTARLGDVQAKESLRFIWGDRDSVLFPTADDLEDAEEKELYNGLKLGDIFHSNPAIIGAPANVFYAAANLPGYRDFAKKFRYRRRVLFSGANDGLLHAFDIGAWNRNICTGKDEASGKPTPAGCYLCGTLSSGVTASCYDLGTGTELFAYAPRAAMPAYFKLRSSKSQDKLNQWTVDGAPSATDVYIDRDHDGATIGTREWRTVVVGTQREGSPFQGVSGQSSYGSVYALDVTQPDELDIDGTNPVDFTAPDCLVGGTTDCPVAWPTVLWEISDRGDLDKDTGTTGDGYPDMGETWSKPGLGRIRICPTEGCTVTDGKDNGEDKYVAVFGGGFDRERKHRRGNWLYIIDIETGKVLYRANGGAKKTASGETAISFGSIPSEPTAIDLNGDGYLDWVYVGDAMGQLWRVDLSDLRYAAASRTADRWDNEITLEKGSAKPFLLFQARQDWPVTGSGAPYRIFPVYQRPVVFGVAGNALGVGFGTGDRDDILAALDPDSLKYSQRFFVVFDRGNTRTFEEADLTLLDPDPTKVTTISNNGWVLEFAATGGERLFTDALALQGYIFFSTFTPRPPSLAPVNCSDAIDCKVAAGISRFYSIGAANGNPAPGNKDGSRSTVIPNTDAVTNPIAYVSANKQMNIGFMTASGAFEKPPTPKKTGSSVRDWKER